MTPNEILARIKPPYVPRCGICAGVSGHPPIPEEGFSVCYPCLLRLGRAAGAPNELSVTEAVVLEEMHGDIVTVEPCVKHGFCWRWDRSWPDTGEFELVGEVA